MFSDVRWMLATKSMREVGPEEEGGREEEEEMDKDKDEDEPLTLWTCGRCE